MSNFFRNVGHAPKKACIRVFDLLWQIYLPSAKIDFKLFKVLLHFFCILRTDSHAHTVFNVAWVRAMCVQRLQDIRIAQELLPRQRDFPRRDLQKIHCGAVNFRQPMAHCVRYIYILPHHLGMDLHDALQPF